MGMVGKRQWERWGQVMGMVGTQALGVVGTSDGDGGDVAGGRGGAGRWGHGWCWGHSSDNHEDMVVAVATMEVAGVDAGPVPAQMASRHVALLAVLKLVPRWLAALLVRTGLIYWISPVFRMAATSHSEAVARLTADHDLRALLSYLFYGQGAVAIGRAPLR